MADDLTFARPGYAPPPMDPALRASILDQAFAFKLGRAVGLFATQSPDGFPRFIGMGILHDGWRSFASTIAGTLKDETIRHNPRVTLMFSDSEFRRDHFVQIDGYAVALTGDEFAEWQRRRFEKWPQELERYDAVNQEWSGWFVEPIRVRVNGLTPRGTPYWGEAPAVFTRKDLGLPPLPPKRPAKRGPLALSEIGFRVDDLAAESAFWEDALGLERVVPVSDGPPATWAAYDVGGPRLQFGRKDLADRRDPRRAHIPGEPSFLVSNIEAAVERALAAGATAVSDLTVLGGEGREPFHKFIFLVSPGGVPFGLVEGDEAAYRLHLAMRPRAAYW